MYRAVKLLIRLALGFYFRRIERNFAFEIPARGPILFVCNHPGSLTDSFVLGGSLHRKIHFLATVQMFQMPLLKWFLLRCGVIPINRAGDNPRGMRSVTDTFEICHQVLERGEAIGIFPEGITYDDSQLKEIKSGAARIALDLEFKHHGKLGLLIVPVGLTYSAKERYRSEALCQFGLPIRAAEYVVEYGEHRKECLRHFSEVIRQEIEKLILKVQDVQEERVVGRVKNLYAGGFSHGAESPSAGLEESRAVAAALKRLQSLDPARVSAFSTRLEHYDRTLQRLHVADQSVASATDRNRSALIWKAVLILCAFPVALFGWLHRAIPFALVHWARKHFAHPDKQKAQAAIVAIIAGTVVFLGWYSLCVIVFHRFFGWPVSFYYALSLPAASLVAYYYGRKLRDLWRRTHDAWIFLRAPAVKRRLIQVRSELVAEIKRVQDESRQIAVPGRILEPV